MILAWRVAHHARRHQDQQFGVLILMVLVARKQPDLRNVRDSRRAVDHRGELVLQQSCEHRRFVLLYAHRLRYRVVRNHRNAVETLAAQAADVEIQLQRDFAIQVNSRRSLHLQSDIDVLHSGKARA